MDIYVGLWRGRSILTSYHNSLQFLTSHAVIGRALGRAPLILQVPHQTSLPTSLASALHLSQVPSGSSFQMPHVLSIHHVSYLQFSNIPFFSVSMTQGQGHGSKVVEEFRPNTRSQVLVLPTQSSLNENPKISAWVEMLWAHLLGFFTVIETRNHQQSSNYTCNCNSW